MALGALLVGCGYGSRHAIQWDSRRQIWQAEASQVKVRAAQSRVFDMTDRPASMLRLELSGLIPLLRRLRTG